MVATPIFREVQLFKQNRFFLIALGAGVFMIIFFSVAMIQQLGFGKPFTSDPLSDKLLLTFGVLYNILGVVLVYLFISGQLVTEVRSDGVYYKMAPLHRAFRMIQTANIDSCEAKIYRPIRDYGGWGIRSSRKGRAYNVSGNRGVMFNLKTGRRILIGSGKPEAFVGAIRQITKNKV